MYLYRMSGPVEFSAAAAIDRNEGWELLSAEHVDWLLEIGPFDVSDGLLRLQRGDCCYTVRLDGRLAHYSWVQRSGLHPITEAGRSVLVGGGEFWIYHCRTAEWARGKGIYPATLERIVRDHFESGYSTAWIYTTQENFASQRGILRAGFGLQTTFTAIRLGNRYYRLGK